MTNACGYVKELQVRLKEELQSKDDKISRLQEELNKCQAKVSEMFILDEAL